MFINTFFLITWFSYKDVTAFATPEFTTATWGAIMSDHTSWAGWTMPHTPRFVTDEVRFKP